MWLRSDFHPWREKRLAVFPRDMTQADCTNSTALLPHPVTQSALLSCTFCLTEAEPCAPHSSASWVSVSPERHSQRGLWWKSGGPCTTEQVPWIEGARNVGSIRTSHLWQGFPSRILCESEDLGSCGWVLPIPYFSVEQSSWGWCRGHWGTGVRPLSVQREPRALWIPYLFWPWYSSSLSPEVSPSLDSGPEGTVWSLSAGSWAPECHFNHEMAFHPFSWLIFNFPCSSLVNQLIILLYVLYIPNLNPFPK